MKHLDRDTLSNSVFKSLAWDNSALIIKVARGLDISSSISTKSNRKTCTDVFHVSGRLTLEGRGGGEKNFQLQVNIDNHKVQACA